MSLELLNGTIVLLQAIFVVGLRLLGQKQIDPFGLDFEDLSVITYVTTTIENSRIILSTPSGDAVDDILETQLSNTNNAVTLAMKPLQQTTGIKEQTATRGVVI